MKYNSVPMVQLKLHFLAQSGNNSSQALQQRGRSNSNLTSVGEEGQNNRALSDTTTEAASVASQETNLPKHYSRAQSNNLASVERIRCCA